MKSRKIIEKRIKQLQKELNDLVGAHPELFDNPTDTYIPGRKRAKRTIHYIILELREQYKQLDILKDD